MTDQNQETETNIDKAQPMSSEDSVDQNSPLKTSSDLENKPPPEPVKVDTAVKADAELEIKPLPVRLWEVLYAFAPLGLIAFGGPAAHIGILHTQFVEKYEWLTDDRFVELMAVGQGLPGPTSTQMVIATGASHAGILGGLLAFFLWNIPSFIVLVTVALVSRENLDPDELPDQLSGLAPAAVSLVFIAAYKLGMKVLKADVKLGQEEYVEKIKLFLATVSTVVTLLVTGEDSFNDRLVAITFPALLIGGGLVTLVDSRREGKVGNYFKPPDVEEQRENESILKTINISPYVGALLILIWLGLLGSFVTLRALGIIGEDGKAALFEAMFRMGSIIYGGGQVVLPMLLTEVVDTGWVSRNQFFQGFALVQALPGPLFNFSSYLGAIYEGLTGAFIAWAGLFGPGLLLILAFLPFWMKVRKVPWFKCFLAGVNAAAIGLVVAATAQLWEAAVETWADAATFFFTGSFILFFDPREQRPTLSKLWVPIGVLFGGLFGYMLTATDFSQDF
eukprot:snap_masked-scaffold_4-processed-gene-16.25-mRNA-1 protein AED:0.03 eAED:0.05 QI:0/-1/0/1/-1/1/1/0/505